MLIHRRHRHGILSQLVAAFAGCVGLITVEISPGLCDWPEGTYGLPAPRDGCPSNDGLYRWKQGMVLQKTEYGSHTSDSINLFGMTDVPSDRIYQTFCMKTSYQSSDNRKHFMPGKYCILKLHQCPARFLEGWIYWDDAGPWFGRTIQNSSGVLPDGNYDRNTRIEYCCRLDGDTNDKIVLPTTDPFYLLKYGDLCQEVEDMDVGEEWVYWAGEKSYNLDEERGVYPKIERRKFPVTYTKLFYCYYTPKPRAPAELTLGPGFETFLTVMCFVGAVLGIILLVAAILATIQKALISREQRHQQQQQLQQQSRQSQKNVRNDRIAESPMSMKPMKGYDLPEYSRCKPPSKVGIIHAERMKDPVKKDSSGPTVDAMAECCSVDSIKLQTDVDSEAPPSYDEVLKDGNLNFIA